MDMDRSPQPFIRLERKKEGWILDVMDNASSRLKRKLMMRHDMIVMIHDSIKEY